MIELLLSLCDTEQEQQDIKFIYENYYDIMYRAAYSIVKNQEVALDLVHDTMLRLIKNRATIRIDGTFPIKTYVVTATRNAAIDYLRSYEKKGTVNIDELSVQLEMRDTAPSALDIIIAQEQYDTIVRYIKELPIVYRDACYLKYVCSLETDAIALTLGITEKNAMMRLLRGRRILKDKIEEGVRI